MIVVKDYLAFVTKYADAPLTEWQLQDIEGVLSHRFSFLIWPSGYGKTLCSALVISAHLILSRHRIISFGAAGDLDQALLLQAALDQIFTHDDLQRLVAQTHNKIKLRHFPKSVHRTLATHAASTWGVTPDFVFLDEVAEATPRWKKCLTPSCPV